MRNVRILSLIIPRSSVLAGEDGGGRWVRHRLAFNYRLFERCATELPQLSTVGILGRCSLDSSRVDLSTNSRGGVAQW
jgi:hypothetical protein